MAANDDDEVGYGRPPKAHRFRKGQSGNPRGRPPKSVGPSEPIIQKVLRRRVPIMMEGRIKRITIGEGVALQMVEQAGRGKIGALRYLMIAQKKMEEEGAYTSVLPTEPSIPVSEVVNMMDVIECLLAADILYMRGNGAFVFEQSKIEAFTTENPEFIAKVSGLTFIVGSRAKDPDAMVLGDEETLLDVFERLSGEAK